MESWDGELSSVTVHHTELPSDLKIIGSISKGANNHVMDATLGGRPCIFRVPRRRSDTQQRGSAQRELNCMMRAAGMNVGPVVYTAWYARHADGKWPSGLYTIMERFDVDLDSALCEDNEHRENVCEHKDAISASICTMLQSLAKARMFTFDLKPSNLVLRFDEEGVVVRFIDFGQDFCETDDNPSMSPNLALVRHELSARKSFDEDEVTHILFGVMLIILGSTTTSCMRHTRAHHRMDKTTRFELNPLASAVNTFLQSVQGRNLRIMKHVLRNDEVRGVLRHYHGRRSSGTKRTVNMAKGIEV